MWCENCQSEVTSTRSPVSGNTQCTQCGHELESLDSEGGSSIAQTAQALLKRWEESRPAAAAREAVAPQGEEELNLDLPDYSSEEAKQTTSASFEEKYQKSVEGHEETIPAYENRSQNDLEKTLQSWQERNHQRPAVKKSEPEPAPKTSQPENKQTTSRPMIPVSEQSRKPESSPPPPQRPKAASNDASTLMNKKEQQRESEPSRTLPQNASPQTSGRQQPPASSGRVRFASPAMTHQETKSIVPKNIPTFNEPTFEKRPVNMSAVIGQFLVYAGALAMTGGVAIIVGNRFGSLEIAESTGWLAGAGGHLLFILGVYTYLSSRMEQLVTDLHQRNDALTRLIRQQQTVAAASAEGLSESGQPNNDIRNRVTNQLREQQRSERSEKEYV